MVLPDNVSTVTVTGTFLDASGEPLAGQVTFTPSAVLSDDSGDPDVVIVGASVKARLDKDGSFSVALAATDDADLSPTGWTYAVEERVAGQTRTYSISLPASPSTVDLAEVVPVEDVADVSAFARLAMENVFTESQTLESTFDGGENDTDSTRRLNLESHQRATLSGPFGEILRVFLRRANAKAMIAWYEDYTGHADSPRTVAWIGAHGQSNDGSTWHNHWSVEVPDENGLMQSVLEIPFASWDEANGYGIADADRYVRALAQMIVSQAPLTVEGPAGTFRELEFISGERGDSTGRRWSIRANADAESGSDAGSNLEIVRRADDGSPVADAVEIRRSDGRIFVGEDVRYGRADRGPVLEDRTTGTQYRLFVDNGVLDIEAVP